MEKKDNETSGGGEVQVFELTMDNPEDQEELNRQLRKPGEPPRSTPAKIGGAGKANRQPSLRTAGCDNNWASGMCRRPLLGGSPGMLW